MAQHVASAGSTDRSTSAPGPAPLCASLHVSQLELWSDGHSVVLAGTWRSTPCAVRRLVLQGPSACTAAQNRAVRDAVLSSALTHPHLLATYHLEARPLAVLSQPPAPVSSGAPCLAEPQRPQVAGASATAAAVSLPSLSASPASLAGAAALELLIAQELCNLGSCAQLLAQRALGDGVASADPHMRRLLLGVMWQAAAALEHLHSRGVMHGGVSPAALHLKLLPHGETLGSSAGYGPGSPLPPALHDSRLVAKLSSFDCSFLLPEGSGSVAMPSAAVGSAACAAGGGAFDAAVHCAPEVLERGRGSTASDMHSFGSVCVALCFGRSLREACALYGAPAGSSPAGTSGTGPALGPRCVGPLAGSGAVLRLPEACPEMLASVLSWCLSPDPAIRPPARSVMHALEQLLHST